MVKTTLLNQHITRRKQEREALRQRKLTRTLHALDTVLPRFGVRQAYCFGSLVKPYTYRETSDIDIAVHGLQGKHYLTLKVALERELDEEIDLVELQSDSLSQRIIREGIEWTG